MLILSDPISDCYCRSVVRSRGTPPSPNLLQLHHPQTAINTPCLFAFNLNLFRTDNRSLVNLGLSGLGLGDEILQSLVLLPDLEYLYVGGNSLTPDAVPRISRMRKLKILNIMGLHIDYDTVRDAFPFWHKVQVVT